MRCFRDALGRRFRIDVPMQHHVHQIPMDRCYLIEVNCNPNIDAGNEDQVLGEALYREVLGVFARRIEERRTGT